MKINLKTDRLVIRNLTSNDTTALYELKYDPAVMKYSPDFMERNITRERVTSFIEKYQLIDESGDITSKRLYAVELQESGEMIGAITIAMNTMLHEYELGWKIRSEHTKKGYASEAASAFCEYFCELLHLDYIIVVMDVDNPASYRAAEKAGFHLFEERIVYDYSYQNYGDHYHYFRRYYSKSDCIEKFYGDVEYTGRGAMEEDQKNRPVLIMLRGNSGSGKSTIAKALQHKLGRGTLYIPQDVVRRELLWVHDHPHNVAIPMLQLMLEFGATHCDYTIIEGILYAEDYQDVFDTARKTFGNQIFAYYFDLPFEETLTRHQTKPNRDEFGEHEMREWFIEKDLVETIPEQMIHSEESVEEIMKRIMSDVQR